MRPVLYDRFMQTKNRRGNRMLLARNPNISTTGSTTTTKSTSSCGKGADNSNSRISRLDGAVTYGRFLFALCHLTLAIIMATLSFAILSNAEKRQADVQLDYHTSRAFSQAASALQQGQFAALTMASLVSELFPWASQSYPQVAIPGFERIVTDLLNATKSEELGFAPFVQSEQLQEWEEFAYDYYYNRHLPQPFLNTTAVSSFGRGVWALDPQSDASDKRVRDLGNPASSTVAPLFQMNHGPDPLLMFNLHSDPITGSAIDQIVQCVQDRWNDTNIQAFPYSRQDQVDLSCGSLVPLTTSMAATTHDKVNDQGEHTGRGGPVTIALQPVRPAKDKDKVTGVIAKITLWDTFIDELFAEDVVGIDCILSVEARKERQRQAYTYRIWGGKVVEQSSGDLHSEEYDSDCREQQLTLDNLFPGPHSSTYTLTICPTFEYYDSYTTRYPGIALVGSICIMLFISLSFYFYDRSVRKVTVEKNDFISARHRFMRFVSHEVRTPLNAVCMGLDVIADTMDSLSELLRNSTQAGEVDPIHQQQLHVAEECRGFVSEIKVNAQGAVDVLSDVLDYERSEQNDWLVNVDVIPVWKFLDRVIDELRTTLEGEKLSLEYSVLSYHDEDGPKYEGRQVVFKTTEAPSSPPEADSSSALLCLLGDGLRLKQVLRNLIGNAIKFTPEGGSILIRAGAEPAESLKCGNTTSDLGWNQILLPKTRKTATVRVFGKLHFKVKDTGEKFTKEQQKHLFGKRALFNPDDLQSGRGGGLGLWISKEIVERHEGSLKGISSDSGPGVTFKLTLPLYQVKQRANPEQPQPREELATTDSGRRPLEPAHEPTAGEPSSLSEQQQPPSSSRNTLRLLIVDDAVSNRKFLRRLLERKGHICEEAVNGQMAVDKIKQEAQDGLQYDSILMDYEMPEMDGPTATKLLRSLGYGIFIVGVTGNLSEQDVNYFLECGANAVLGKPLRIQSLDKLWMDNGILSSNDEAPRDEPEEKP